VPCGRVEHHHEPSVRDATIAILQGVEKGGRRATVVARVPKYLEKCDAKCVSVKEHRAATARQKSKRAHVRSACAG
jgi:hypothetical protein